MVDEENLGQNAAYHCTCSILLNLIRYSRYYSSENLEKLAKYYNYFSLVNEEFSNHFLVVAIKYFRLQYLVKVQEFENKVQVQIKQPLPHFKNLAFYLNRLDRLSYVASQLKQDIIIPLQLFVKDIKEQNSVILAMQYELLQQYFEIVILLFDF